MLVFTASVGEICAVFSGVRALGFYLDRISDILEAFSTFLNFFLASFFLLAMICLVYSKVNPASSKEHTSPYYNSTQPPFFFPN